MSSAYTDVLRQFQGDRSDDSAVGVAVEAIRLLTTKAPTQFQLSLLLPALMDAICSCRDVQKWFLLIAKQVQRKSYLFPTQQWLVSDILQMWIKRRII